MKPLYSSLLATILLLIITPHYIQASKNSAIDNFLQCLPRYSNPIYPISNAMYTNQNGNNVSSFHDLQFNTRGDSSRLPNRTYSASKPRPPAVVAALDEYYVQATLLCARVNGLRISGRNEGGFDGVSYVSDVPLVILDI